MHGGNYRWPGIVMGCLLLASRAATAQPLELPHGMPAAGILAPAPALPHIYAPQPLPVAPMGVVPLATTVQLPTFAFFTSSTTVSVPDSGGAYLGGVGRSSSGSTAYGPNFGLPNRAFAAQGGATSTRVEATIHNLAELDAALVHGAVAGPLAVPAATRSPSNAPPLVSVDEARRQFAAEQNTRQLEARRYLEQAEAAIADGKPGVARIYLQMAARRAGGELLADVQARLRALNASSTAPQ